MNFEQMPRVYVSATMRSGSTLVSNILNAHSKVQIIENFHFQRFLYDKGGKLNKKNVQYKLREMGLRLKIRYNVKINEKKVIREVLKKKLTYKNIYDELMREQLKINPNIKIVGEDSAMNWRFIKKFCSLYENAKVIHLIRDPRSVFASWKKATYQKKDYWGCIINCIDNMNYAKIYKKQLDKKNYMVVRFEDILKNPEMYAKKFANFLGIKYEPNMTRPKKWENLFRNKFASLGWSSIEKKAVNGFFKNRIDAWKRILTSKEISIIEHFTKKNLMDWKYNFSKNNSSNDYLNDFNKTISKSSYLKNIFGNFKKNGLGTDKLKNNSRDPKTWGDGKNNKTKFIDSQGGKIYMIKLKKIKKEIYNNEGRR
tara:strand:+ start:114 stop:1220 length:1107 start_codon:yes stop_codon:yes gene_type:complete